jgi:L-alanine-DL-glutamate epimerase-like enolase superfamily enzyme
VKIVDLKCTNIENFPVIRIDTDEGISGLSQIEHYKTDYIIPHVLAYKAAILGTDPTDVARVMLRISHLGGFKPWGSSVSAIEFALWDIAGKALGAPVYKLLGGKMRDRVRVYCGGGSPFSEPLPRRKGDRPEDFAEEAQAKKALPEKYSIIKQSPTVTADKEGLYSEGDPTGLPYPTRGQPHPKEWKSCLAEPRRNLNQQLTEQGLKYYVACVKAMKEVLGDEVGLALHATFGNTPQGLLSLAKALEPYNVMWLEDAMTGDYFPWTAVEAYRLVSSNTTTPIHTGEQIYLRHGCRGLIENNAIDVLGMDPCDCGGIAELKWITEYADLYGITVAPHGVGNGVFGCAAMVQMAATMPKNYIAFEMPRIPPVWCELTKGFPRDFIKDSYIEVPNRPGMGLELNEKAVRKHLPEGDDFFATKGK